MVIPMFKSLLATVLVLSTCLGTSVHAARVNKYGVRLLDVEDFPARYQRLATALATAGIDVVDGHNWEACKPTETTITKGFYAPAENFIVLCTNNQLPDIMTTFVHEAVHAVQDCRAGLDNPILLNDAQSFMLKALKPGELEWIRQAYPEHQWMDEVEARYLDQYPNTVSMDVNWHCNI